MRLQKNPKIPEGINTSNDSPMKEFFLLLSGVMLAIVALVITVSLLAQTLSPLIPFAWETQLIKSAINLPDTEKTPKHTEAESAIRELVDELSRHIENDNLNDPFSFSVHLIDDPLPNAFATLGGNIIVTRGLLENITSENSLAMVLAHEMSHVTRRHPIQSVSRGAIIQLVVSILAGSQGNSAAQAILGQTGLLTLLTFNRNMETEADDDAIKILLKKYQHLEDADILFTAILSKKDNHAWISFFETHPNTAQRIKNIQQQAKEIQLNGTEKATPLNKHIINYINSPKENQKTSKRITR